METIIGTMVGQWLEKALIDLCQRPDTSLNFDRDVISGLVSYCDLAQPVDAKEYLDNIIGKEGKSIIAEYLQRRGYKDPSNHVASCSSPELQFLWSTGAERRKFIVGLEEGYSPVSDDDVAAEAYAKRLVEFSHSAFAARLIYPSILTDDDLLAALCFDQSSGVEDPYGYIQTNEDNIFHDFGSSGVNLQPQQEQSCNIVEQFDSFAGNFQQVRSFRGEYSSSIGSTQLDLAPSFSGVLQQEAHQVYGFREQNDNSAVPHLQQEQGHVCNDIVEINSSSSVKEELEHVGEECSRKRKGTESCSKIGNKVCREKLRREKLNERFMDLSSVLEPGRTPKTDKLAILNEAIRAVNQLRGEAHVLKETNQKLLEDIKNLKAEKTDLREEKLVLKADKEKIVQQLKSMAVPSSGFMPSQHPAAAFHLNKMSVYSSYCYYPWPYFKPADCDTSHDHKNHSYAA